MIEVDQIVNGNTPADRRRSLRLLPNDIDPSDCGRSIGGNTSDCRSTSILPFATHRSTAISPIAAEPHRSVALLPIVDRPRSFRLLHIDRQRSLRLRPNHIDRWHYCRLSIDLDPSVCYTSIDGDLSDCGRLTAILPTSIYLLSINRSID